jgi:hypothetical protein
VQEVRLQRELNDKKSHLEAARQHKQSNDVSRSVPFQQKCPDSFLLQKEREEKLRHLKSERSAQS